MRKEEEVTKPHYGTVNFEKRKHPRFNVELPVEYIQSDRAANHGEAINVSEGGLLVYFPEKIEVGQSFSLKLFFPSEFEFNIIEALVKVVWMDIHIGENWGDYRAGVKFVDISPVDLEKVKVFLGSLSE